MSDGALRISILGDASQFKETLADLQKRLEGFKEDLKTATGAAIPDLNFKINGIETSIKQITEFGKFAEGSLGFYEQLKKQLEGELRVTTNRAEQEQLNKRLLDTVSIIKEIKSAGIEIPIPVPIVIEPPPPGSIADIKNQISEVIKEKQIAIGVNLTNANIKLQDLKNKLSVLEKQGIEIPVEPITPVLENSIQGIKNKIDELNRQKVLLDIDDKQGLATINKELDGLNTRLVKANSTSFDKDGKITSNSTQAGRALTSLSLIAQDLPFGFIAIQNNIPALAESFGQLKNQSGGFKGALKELGAVLTGPVGISFAIASVVSGLTVLVQKYGSLSTAITEVLNLTKTQRDLNVELGAASASSVGSAEGEITVLKTLTGVLTNNKLSLDARNGAYDELNKKYPGFLTLLDQEKLKTGELNTELAKRLELITAQIKLNGQRATLEKLIAEEAEKSFRNFTKLQNQTFLDALTSELGAVLKGFNAGTAGLQDFSQSVSNGAKSTQFYKTKLEEIQAELSAVDGQILAIVEAGKKKQKQDEAEAKAAEELKKKALERAAALKKEKEALEKKAAAELKAIEARQKERTLRVSTQVQFDLQALANRDTSEILKKRIKEAQKEVSRTAGAIQIPVTFPSVDPLRTLNNIKLAIAEFEKLKKAANLKATTELLSDTFFSPLQNLFTDLVSNSKSAFQEFTKAILQSINQIVAKIITTGIISLLANLISGGTAGLGKAVLGDVINSLGFKKLTPNPIGRIISDGDALGAANFGGIRGADMTMSGQVVVALRGSDLVGAINRTNTTINRVG